MTDDRCAFHIGHGKTWRRCPNKGKYKQSDSPDIPRVCGVHWKMHLRLNRELGGIVSDMWMKLGRR